MSEGVNGNGGIGEAVIRKGNITVDMTINEIVASIRGKDNMMKKLKTEMNVLNMVTIYLKIYQKNLLKNLVKDLLLPI